MSVAEIRNGPGISDRRRRIWVGVLVVAWGAQAIVTQSLLLREAIVLMFGSELAWGVVLFAWLFGVAVGASLGARLAERLTCAEVGLVVTLLFLSVTAGVELWLFRGARGWLGVSPGELLPLPKTVLAAMLFVSPAGALVGLAFPFACCVRGMAEPPAATGTLLQFGHVYALESLGSLIGGAAFSFWAVEHLAPIQTLLVCGTLTAAAAAGALSAHTRLRISVVIAAIVMMLLTIFTGKTLNNWLVELRWRNIAPGYELVVEVESKYQNLAIGRLDEQYTLYSDGQVSADFPDPYTFVPLAHFWLCQHPAPRNVLLIGGGAEGLLAEILRHPIEYIDYIEPDPRQIKLLEPYLTDVDRQALCDARVSVHHVDARYYIKMQRDRFDLVIARLPEPTSALRARFYTDDFYGELRRAMTPQSVLCLTASAAPGKLSQSVREYLASIRATIGRHFPQIVIGWGTPAQVLAASAPELLSTSPAELARRYTQRGVTAGLFDPELFWANDWLDADKLARRAADIDLAEDVQISTDLWPTLYMQRLALWEAASSGGVGPGRDEEGVLRKLRSISLPGFAAVLLAGGGITLITYRLRQRTPAGWATGALMLSVATTGFVTMALSIVWLFAFQNLYGYVYQRIGWIIALFMGGLVLGCFLASRLETCNWRRLVLVDVLLVVLALAVPVILPALGALPSGPTVFVLVEACISIMVILTGLLGGAAFTLAGRLRLDMSGRVGAAAGSVVGADHAGACLGALSCGLLLVPVFGITMAAFLLAGIKLGSAALLVIGRRFQG